MMLKDLGYTEDLENFRKKEKLDSFSVGRVISMHKGKCMVKTDKGDFEAGITGKLRFLAKNKSDFPAVGDWVAIAEHDEDKALIRAIFPRKTIIEREATRGGTAEKQIIATNVDYALIFQAVDRDFNINRLERYLTICNASGVKPIIILTKIDLINETQIESIVSSIQKRIKNIPVFTISNETEVGYEKLLEAIEKRKTYCLLGSSGVGKSTFLNNISGKELMKTGPIGSRTNKGRHITSHRELVVLKNGGILIDNPGMRGVGVTDAEGGLEVTYDKIIELSQNCKFNDCKHVQEKDCAVLEAVKKGYINKASYDNYIKMEKEKTHFTLTLAEKRKKDKNFGKMIKKYKKQLVKDNY